MASVTFATQTIKRPQYVASIASGFGILAFGTSFSWSSSAASPMRAKNDYLQVTASEFVWIASAFNLGCAASCLFINYFMNTFGRRNAMLGLTVPLMIGWGCIVWTDSLTMILVGRFLVGFGGAFYYACQQYIEEITEDSVRRIAKFFPVIFFMAGILLSNVVGAFISVNDLFILNVFCSILPIIFCGIFFLMPESPIFLVMKMEDRSAAKALKFLRGNHFNYVAEINDLKQKIILENEKSCSILEAFYWELKTNKIMLFVEVGLKFFLQMTGMTTIVLFSKDIFKIAGSDPSPNISIIVLGIVFVVATILTTLLVKDIKGEAWLIASTLLMTISLLINGVYFLQKDNIFKYDLPLQWIPLTFLSLFAAGFSFVLVLTALLSFEEKSEVKTYFGALNWILAFIVSSGCGFITTSYGIGIMFLTFGSFTLILSIFPYFVIRKYSKTLLN